MRHFHQKLGTRQREGKMHKLTWLRGRGLKTLSKKCTKTATKQIFVGHYETNEGDVEYTSWEQIDTHQSFKTDKNLNYTHIT